MSYIHLEVGTEADDALHVRAVIAQHVLPAQQRDVIFIHGDLATKNTCLLSINKA